MLSCQNCNCLNPPKSKFCNQCSRQISPSPSSAPKDKNLKPHMSEKKVVILSLIVASTLIIGLSALISYKGRGSRVVKSANEPVTTRTIPSADIQTRRMKIARVVNEEIAYDKYGSPLDIEVRGKYAEALRIYSPTLPDELYEDFGRQTELIRRLKQEGFEVVIFADATKHRNYYLNGNN